MPTDPFIGEPYPDTGLRRPNRYITDHDSTGKTTFDDTVPSLLPWQSIGGTSKGSDLFSLVYATEEFPVQLTDKQDVQVYRKFVENKPGITIRGGTVLRYVDIAPGATSPMHRTISLDYGVVLEGEVESILDSGEKRLLKRGDILIQRGTNHAWRNVSETSWARMLYVLQEAQALTVAGKTFGEDYGGIQGVRSST
ncbi:putative cupin domain containing protein [Phaeomoniella chlamydospora]|uniref:Putative cupin domain containing protein n=1 Tax=Phaeomoniella chlamydospora TaxID=158046 RepID=A0A0G2E3E1_PHACM|nr:putative cupin domain containing protein [Phaeomoniella chlamydospora]